MRKEVIFIVLIFFSCSLMSQENEKNFSIGANLVTRHFKTSDLNIYYPRLSAEYRWTPCSSAEFIAEYVNYTVYVTYPAASSHRSVSLPISLGYRLNVVPWFSKNEQLTNRLKVYNSLRYTLLLAAADPKKPFNKFYVFHKIRYAPGVDFYFHPSWGVNAEMVFGNNMRTTMSMGIKFRF